MSAELVGLALLGTLAFAAAARVLLAPLDGGPGVRRALAAAVVLLAGAAAIYAVVGRPEALRERAAAAEVDQAEVFAREIVARLAQQPDDVAGWRMLGGVRGMQGRYAEAAAAFARARSLSGDTDLGALVGYAEAQVLEDPTRLAAMAPLFARALELDPDDQKALWYGGHAAADAGDRERAVALWSRLLRQDIPEPLRASLRAQLGAAAPGATAAQAGAPAPGAADGAALLEVEVTLAPELAARATPGAPLFVFVRAPGVAAPVLVKRVMQPRFPQRIVFTAADRLGAAVPIAPGFKVGARLSKLGTAGRGSGDIEGDAVVATNAKVAVTLDQIVP